MNKLKRALSCQSQRNLIGKARNNFFDQVGEKLDIGH